VLQHVPDRGLGLGGAELRRVDEGEPHAADGHGLEQRVAPFGNGGEMEYRIAFEQAVIADVFAVRSLGFDQPALVDIAFEHQFGVGRNADIDGDAFHHRHRRAAHRTDHVELVHRCHRGDGGEKIGGVAADREGDGHALAPGDRGVVERAQIARGVEVDAGGARAAQHQAPATNIGEARLRIARVVDAGRDIRCAVEPVLQVHGQRGQIGIVAGEHDLVHRRLRGRHFVGATGCRRRWRSAAGKPGSSVSSATARRRRVPITLPTSSVFFRPDRAKPDRVGITIQHRGHVDEVDRIVMDDAFALLHELLDEMAQTKFFGIGHEDAFQSIARSVPGDLSGPT